MGWLVLRLVLALASVGCLGDFDPESRTFCRSEGECVAGWRCDLLLHRCVLAVPGDQTEDAQASDTLTPDVPGPDDGATGDADLLDVDDASGESDVVPAMDTTPLVDAPDLDAPDLDAALPADVVEGSDVPAAEEVTADDVDAPDGAEDVDAGDVGCNDACPLAGQLVCTASVQELRVCVLDGDCLVLGPPIVCDFDVTCEAPCETEPCAAVNACVSGGVCHAAGALDATSCQVCAGGSLGLWTARDCSDGNACTIDACDGGCTSKGASGTACDDGDGCTTLDHCAAGVCLGTAVDCGDGDACTRSTCVALGDVATCASFPRPSSASCDDGSECTDSDHCDGEGACVGAATPSSCDDQDPCTDDACVNGACRSTAKPCQDGRGCTADGCAAGVCTFTPLVGPCTDGDACTADDACVKGRCVGAALDCDDGSACTVDTCTPVAGCAHARVPCADVGCRTTVCQDLGHGQTECVLAGKSATGQSCDDGLPCTTSDACDALGGCSGAVAAGACAIGGGCYLVGQRDPLSACRVCDEGAPRAWAFVVDGTDCDDGDACSSSSACQQGACTAGSIAACDDDNPCTVDSCSAATGCVHTLAPNLSVCDRDGLPCTVDRCSAGQCVRTAVAPSSCFVESSCWSVGEGHSGPDGDCVMCDPSVNSMGWVPSVAMVGVGCDSNPCRTSPTCDDAGHCSGGTALDGASCPEGVCFEGDCWHSVAAGPSAESQYYVNLPIPPRCVSLDVRAAGAGGGGGGYGGTVGGRLAVAEGKILTLAVAAGGTLGGALGPGRGGNGFGLAFYRGGDGGAGGGASGIGGSGGGGATTVGYDQQTRFIAGGGGGSAFGGGSPGHGGQFPALDGTDGDSPYPLSGGAGRGGSSELQTPMAGGVGNSGGSAGQTVTDQFGGTGGAGAGSYPIGGGGGGAGYVRGGSGGGGFGGEQQPSSGGGGGGGGGSFIHSSVSDPTSWSPPTGYSRSASDTAGQPGLVLYRCSLAVAPACRSPEMPDGAPCDDGDACTVADTCQGGTCTPGASITCPDPAACRGGGVCDPGTGACTYAPVAAGTACDDADPCTLEDACSGAGVCEPGASLSCSTPNECDVAGTCSPGTGACPPPTPRANGTTCDDGSRCTFSDRCVAGQCNGLFVPCDDDNPCTSDSCDPASGCVTTTTAKGTACDDGLSCTSASSCDGARRCVGTLDAGRCLIDGVCFSNNAVSPLNGCELCKVSASTSTWTVLQESASCDDGTVCTTASRCLGGICEGTAAVACDDHNPCTDDVCDPVLGCRAVEDDTNTCDLDGKACTLDACAAGTCTPGPIAPGACLIDGGCYGIDASRGAPNTTCAICDPFASQTAWTSHDEGLACDPCRTGATCQSGFCEGGTANPAADGEVCAPASGAWAYHCLAGACWGWAPSASGSVPSAYVPPNGCRQVAAELWGAGGGSGGPVSGHVADGSMSGGSGGFAKGSIAVTAGVTLRVTVGSPGVRGGSAAGQGGQPGGGDGGYTGTTCTGGGGGGYSAVRIGETPLLIAGGGGGGSAGANGGASVPDGGGGEGGGEYGESGHLASPDLSGGGGEPSAGGAGGLKAMGVGDAWQGWYVGGSGSALQGGHGHVHGAVGACSGGGGGGGWFGGGGGATWVLGAAEDTVSGGGGGGSGHVSAAVVAGTSALQSADGSGPPFIAALDRFDALSTAFGDSRRRARSEGPGLVLLRCDLFSGQ